MPLLVLPKNPPTAWPSPTPMVQISGGVAVTSRVQVGRPYMTPAFSTEPGGCTGVVVWAGEICGNMSVSASRRTLARQGAAKPLAGFMPRSCVGACSLLGSPRRTASNSLRAQIPCGRSRRTAGLIEREHHRHLNRLVGDYLDRRGRRGGGGGAIQNCRTENPPTGEVVPNGTTCWGLRVLPATRRESVAGSGGRGFVESLVTLKC